MQIVPNEETAKTAQIWGCGEGYDYANDDQVEHRGCGACEDS